MSYRDDMRAAARASLLAALKATNNCVEKAAKIVGTHRTHFYKLCKRYDVKIDKKPTSMNWRGGKQGNEVWRAMQ